MLKLSNLAKTFVSLLHITINSFMIIKILKTSKQFHYSKEAFNCNCIIKHLILTIRHFINLGIQFAHLML